MRNYQNLVFTTAVRLLGNEADAQDIAQTVFLKAYESFEMLSQSPTAGGWLRTVTTNLCLNHLTRYRARWRFFSEMTRTEDEPDYVDSLAAPEALESSLASTDYCALIERALRRLPPAQRVPLVLYHFEGLSYEAIAEQLGVSLSKVKTDIHRGRQALRRRLEPLLRGEPWGEDAPEPDRGSERNNTERSTRTATARPGVWRLCYT